MDEARLNTLRALLTEIASRKGVELLKLGPSDFLSPFTTRVYTAGLEHGYACGLSDGAAVTAEKLLSFIANTERA